RILKEKEGYTMTLEKLIMPQLGESVTEGTINSWLIKEGDYVTKYDPIADVLTDKVNAEIPSSFAGTIKEILADEGETIAVGEVICYIEVEGSVSKEQKASGSPINQIKESTNNVDSEEGKSMKKRYSPAVLKMAQEHDIDLNTVNGSGRGGRITRKDIEKFIQDDKGQEGVFTKKTEEKKQPTKDIELTSADQEIPITGVRKKIAENMLYSTKEIPHAWM